MSWVSLDDEVGAIGFLLEHDVGGPVNLTAPSRSPTPRSPRRSAAWCTARRSSRCRASDRSCSGGELAQALLFDGQRVFPEVLLDAGYEFQHADLESTLHELLGR